MPDDAHRKRPPRSEERPLLVAAAECETERRVLFRRALLKENLQARIVNDLVVLLEYIAHCGGETVAGCKAYVKTYANKLQLPERTTNNRLKVLRDLGFIRSHARKDKSSLVWIDLEAIRDYANRPAEAASQEVGSEQATPTSQAGERKFGVHVNASSASGERNSGSHVNARPAPGERKSCVHIVSSLSSFELVSSSDSSVKEKEEVDAGNSKTGEDRNHIQSQHPTTWRELGQQLAELGLIDVQPAIALARQHGLSPEHVQALIEHFQKHPGAWEPGYLCYRLKNDLPGRSPLEGWPPPSEQYQQQKQAEQARHSLDQAAHRRCEHSARRLQIQQELQQTQKRLERWQDQLQTLSRSDVREILLRQHSEAQAEFLASLGPKNQDVQLAVCDVWEASDVAGVKASGPQKFLETIEV